MTNVSKQSVKKEVLDRITNQFIKILGNLKGFKETNLFIEDFFTDSEKIMITKRLAAIFMLIEDVPFSVIVRTLKISSATLRKMAVILDRGGYGSILRKVEKTRVRKVLWQELETLLRAGLPKYGRGRWDFLNKH